MFCLRYLILSSLFITLSLPTVEAFSADKEIELLRKQMNEMREDMESKMGEMQKKIDSLEKRNKELEQRSDIQVSKPSKPDLDKAQPAGQTFLNRTFRALNPDISLIGIFALAYYSEDEPPGLAEIDPGNTGFNLQELELGIQGVVDPYFRYDTFLVINDEGIEIEEAYGTTLLSLPLNSQFRIGKMRNKFGRINLLHRHSQNFITLPIVATRFLGEHLNPTGIEANFLLPLPWFSELSVFGGSPEVETPSFDRDEDANNLGRLLYVFHLSNFFELSDSFGVNIGGSFATGANGTESGNRTNLWGADLYAKYKPLKNNSYQEVMLQSEFMYRDAESEDGDLSDYGFYTQLVYRFAKRWRAGVRYGWVDTDDPLEILEEEAEPRNSNFLQIANEGEEEEEEHGHGDEVLGLFGEEYRISAMLTFTPSEFSLIRLQYDYNDVGFGDNVHGLFLQFQYAIGAHGAHPF